MQLPFLDPEPFVPLPLGAAHYVPVLQNRTGELGALQHASEETWRGITPLIQIVGPRTKPDAFKATNVSSWVKKVSDAMGDHPLFLDLLRLKPTHPVETTNGNVPVLQRIFWAARRRHLSFVPVLRVGAADTAHVRLVRDCADADGRGVALRYPIRSLALAPAKQQEYFSQLLDTLGTDARRADLLVDLDFIDDDAEIHAEDLGAALTGVLAVGAWRSIVVIGTSIPSMLSCVPEGTLGSLPRREWRLWRSLSAVGLPQVTSFGDYAIQHPTPPNEKGGPSMRANIRYTAVDTTLIARGRGPLVQEGAEQYIGLCRTLVSQTGFAGAGYTWGDRSIEDCANGLEPPGSQNVWRGAGTSHHLRFVTDQLRGRPLAA